MCGISTIDFKNPCHWSWLVGRVFAVGGPTYTRQTVYGHLVNLVNFSTFHCHLINFSSLSFHCKFFKVHTMELVSHKIASGHSWRIRWPKDHRQNKWGNIFALLSVKYLFKHFSPAPLFLPKFWTSWHIFDLRPLLKIYQLCQQEEALPPAIWNIIVKTLQLFKFLFVNESNL